MKKPIVSILVPVYNVEKYLAKCLDSVVNQTLPDIEIICVNDGSTDGSEKILEEYRKKDARIKVITKENGGLPSARNAGLDHAQGKYVGFVDSDDFIKRNMFEKLVMTAEADAADIVICGANIFPEEPEPEEWLKACLSPVYTRYDAFAPELLYERTDTTPFLWRTLIRKEILDAHSLRLDEDIVIGEDKAFQCKVFPFADRITVIPDKLYNYYWCRPDSLMGKQVYGKYERRVLEHAKLVERIGKDLIKNNTVPKEALQKEFVEWSIPFIYDDFMYLPGNEKILAAQKLIPMWKEAGYYMFSSRLPQWKKEAFDYIKGYVEEKQTEVKLTVIITIEYTSGYVDRMLKHIKEFSDDRMEVIILNNGMHNSNYIKVQKLLYTDRRVRLLNMQEHASYAETLNKGVDLASGEYIAFADVQDWFYSKERLDAWLDAAIEKGSDLCVSKYCMKKSEVDNSEEISKAEKGKLAPFQVDYHDVLYRKSFLMENDILFSENSILTGYVFLCKAILEADEITEFNEVVYVLREIHKADWISTEKCGQLLDGLNELMDLSLAKSSVELHGEIFNLLNGDVIKRLISNNTKPYCMPAGQCPNGENSQIKTVRTLFEITGKADRQMLYAYGFTESDNLFETLYEVIQLRHKFLSDLSNEVAG